MRRQEPARPRRRDGFWYLIRRVPKEFALLDRRGWVKISTGIAIADDPRALRAKDVVQRIDGDLQIYWRGLVDGQSAEARIRFEAAQRRARQLGFQYRPAAALAEGPTGDLLDRIKNLIDRDKVDDEAEVTALLGGEDTPALRVSDMLNEFADLQSSVTVGMSPDQVRRWKNQKKRAADNLLEVVGDKALNELSRADAQAYSKWWRQRIEGGIKIGSANKEIGNVSKMFDTINAAHQLNLPPVFEKLRLAGGTDGQRAAFTVAQVEKGILGPGALDGLNDEAAAIVQIIAETGLRLSEACNLNDKTIHLDVPVPYVEVLPDGRLMKTDHSARQIPLVGVSLAAAQRFPKGFPRYRDRGASLSALVNKYMRNAKMLPTAGHSLYSLRHTFEDRLTAAEAPDKVIAMMMGHKWHRPKYGAGPSLAQKRKWLLKIAFKPAAQLVPKPAGRAD